MQMAIKAMATCVLLLLGSRALLCVSGEGSSGNYPFVKEANQNAVWESHYDYIIVGGGTAGCPLAATLSYNATVLLLERGGSPYGNNNISRIENFSPNLVDAFSPRSPTQAFVSEDGVLNQRARVLGGGTCLNAGFYSRASPKEIGAMGLEPKLVSDSYYWVENVMAHRPPKNKWQKAVAQGLVECGVTPFNGFTYDHIPGTKIGGTIFNRSGDRSTAADILALANPKRLTVLLYASAQRLLFVNEGNTKPKAFGVVFTDADGIEHHVFLKEGKSEVIISAGALGSPQLLMLSGIGPAEELNSFGIQVVLDQPAVGQGMADNAMNFLSVPTRIPLNVSLVQTVGITNFGFYIEACAGIGLSKETDTRRTAFIFEKLSRPKSKGYLRLKNTKIADNPIVRFNYLKDPRDLQTCVQGVRTMLNVIKTSPIKQLILPNITLPLIMNFIFGIPKNFNTGWEVDDIVLQKFCKDTVRTIWHFHGGCQVGSVVDGEYRVIGAESVRVIDGSTFRFSPGTNPQATVMMLGRYMGVRILKERLGPSPGVITPFTI